MNASSNCVNTIRTVANTGIIGDIRMHQKHKLWQLKLNHSAATAKLFRMHAYPLGTRWFIGCWKPV